MAVSAVLLVVDVLERACFTTVNTKHRVQTASLHQLDRSRRSAACTSCPVTVPGRCCRVTYKKDAPIPGGGSRTAGADAGQLVPGKRSASFASGTLSACHAAQLSDAGPSVTYLVLTPQHAAGGVVDWGHLKAEDPKFKTDQDYDLVEEELPGPPPRPAGWVPGGLPPPPAAGEPLRCKHMQVQQAHWAGELLAEHALPGLPCRPAELLACPVKRAVFRELREMLAHAAGAFSSVEEAQAFLAQHSKEAKKHKKEKKKKAKEKEKAKKDKRNGKVKKHKKRREGS